MFNRLVRWTIAGTAVISLAACQGDGFVASVPQDPSDLYWSMTLNQRKVVLSLDQSQKDYHQFQIVATPRSLDGSPIELDSKPVYTISDTTLAQVDTNGLVTARKVVPADKPVRVLVTLASPKYKITRTDTVHIAITQNVQPIANFTIQPDSTNLAGGWDKSFAARITNADGDDVPNILVQYGTSNLQVAGIDAAGVVTPRVKGKVMISAQTMAYGIEYRDSVELTVTDPLVFQVELFLDTKSEGTPVYFDPEVITIKAGQGVSWYSYGAFGGVTFDDPTNVMPGPLGGDGGDIPIFIMGKHTRLFPIPGEYTYYEPRLGIKRGKVIVLP